MIGDIYALIRVSTEDQNETRQVTTMTKLGIPKRNIIIEKESGKSTVRTKYNNLVKRLKTGDTLYIENIDRLSRDYDGIIDEWHKLTKQIGIIIKVLDTPMLDTDQKDNSLIWRFIRNKLLHILAFQAENEWHKIKNRQAEGIAVMPVVDGKRISPKTGNPTGRPKSIKTKKQIKVANQYLRREITLNMALKLSSLGRTAFYDLCNSVKNID